MPQIHTYIQIINNSIILQTHHQNQNNIQMSCIDLKQQFHSCLTINPHQSSYWNQPTFMKSCNEALTQIETLKLKINEFDATMNKKRLRSTPDLENKMLRNLDENIKICQNHLKRLQVMQPDMKCSSQGFISQYKNSVLTTIQMKLLESGLKFKQVFQKNRRPSKNSQSSPKYQEDRPSTPNLNRPLFIDQSQQQMMQEVAKNEYKSIQKSIAKISEMYKQTASMVRMHQFMIDSIETDINATEVNVDGGRKNLIQAHRRESKNRPFIIKIFAMLYVTVTVYIVVLS